MRARADLALEDACPRPERPLKAHFASAAKALFAIPGGPAVDFARPVGEPALAAPDSVSWRVFKNPVALFVGGSWPSPACGRASGRIPASAPTR